MARQVAVKITPDFSAATQKIQNLTITVQRLNAATVQLNQRMQAQIIPFPIQKTHLAQISIHFRRMYRAIDRLERLFNSVVSRMVNELGNLSRAIIKGFSIESFVISPAIRIVGGLSFGFLPLMIAASSGIFRWLYDKVASLGDAMIQDRMLSLQAGTTTGAIRAYRTAFPMIDDPEMISKISVTRIAMSSRAFSVLHWLLGVKKSTDSINVAVDTLIKAREYMRRQPSEQAMLAAQLFHLTETISPQVLMVLREMSDEEFMSTVRRFHQLKPRFSQTMEAQNLLVDFILAVKTMWVNIETKLGKKLVELGITDSLKNLSEAALDFIDFALNMPITQRMIKGFEEDLTWFSDWLSDTKNQKRVGKIVQNMILNFEKGIADLVEATGNFEAAERQRHEIRRFEARQGRRERGLIPRPSHFPGFPRLAKPSVDLPKAKRTEPDQTSPPTAPRKPTSPGTRTAPAPGPEKRTEPKTPPPTSTTAPPTAPSTSHVPPPLGPYNRPRGAPVWTRHPRGVPAPTHRAPTPVTIPPTFVPRAPPLGPYNRPRGAPVWTRHPRDVTAPAPAPPPAPTPTPTPTPTPRAPAPPPAPAPPVTAPTPPIPSPGPQDSSTKPALGPYNRQRGAPVWTRHPSAASQPSNQPLPSLIQRQIGDPKARPWTRHLKQFDWTDPANAEELRKAKRESPTLFWKRQIPIRPEAREAFEQRHPESENIIRRQRLRLHRAPESERPIPWEKGGSMGWQQREKRRLQLEEDQRLNEEMGRKLGLEDVGGVPPEKSIAWQPVDPVTLKPTGITPLQQSRDYQFRTRYINPWVRPRGNPASSPSNVPLPPHRPDIPGGDIPVRGDPRTAGIPGLPGGPAGAARYGPPKPPWDMQPEMDVIPGQFRTGQRVPIDLRRYPRPTEQPSPNIAVRPPVTTAGVPGLPGGPSGPRPSNVPLIPPGGDIAVRPPIPTAGVRGLRGGPSGEAAYGLPRPRQFPSVVDNDVITHQFRTGRRVPIDPTRYYRPPGGDIAVRPPVETAGVPGLPGGPSGKAAYGRPKPPQFSSAVDDDVISHQFRTGRRIPIDPSRYQRTPDKPVEQPPTAPPTQRRPSPFPGPPGKPTPEPTPTTGPAQTPGATEIGNWNSYLGRLAKLETGYRNQNVSNPIAKGRPGYTANRGYFQVGWDAVDRARAAGVKDPELMITGDYTQQKTKLREYMTARYPGAADAIERGDRQAADDLLGGEWGSLPSRNQKKINQQSSQSYKEANQILEGSGQRPPDELPGQISSFKSSSATAAAPPKPPEQQGSGSPVDRGIPGPINARSGTKPAAMVIHYTESGPNSTPQSIVAGWKKDGQGIGADYIVDKDGKMWDVRKDLGYSGHGHIHPKFTPQYLKDKGVVNANTIGIEVMTDKEGDRENQKQRGTVVTYARQTPDVPVAGHEEVNPGHRHKDEGMTIVDEIRRERGYPENRKEAREQTLREIREGPGLQPGDPKLTGEPGTAQSPSDSPAIDPKTLKKEGVTPGQKLGTRRSVDWGTPPKMPDVRTDEQGNQYVPRSKGIPTGRAPTPQEWGLTHMVDEKGNIVGETPKNLPSYMNTLPYRRDFSRDVNGKPIDPGVLQQAEKLAASGNKAEVKKFINDQGFYVHDNYCADFVSSVVSARGGDIPGKGPTTSPKTGGPFDTASNWLTHGEHVDPKDVQPGDIAVSKVYTYGPNKGKPIKPGSTGGHIGMVGSQGMVTEGPNKGKFQFFGANPIEERYRDTKTYEFRRIKYPKPAMWGEGEPVPYTTYDPKANPLDNLQVINNSDARASWDKPYGSNVRDLSDVPEPKTPKTQIEDPDKPKRDPERDPDKPKQEVKDPDKPKQEIKDPEKADPGSDEKSDATGGNESPTQSENE